MHTVEAIGAVTFGAGIAATVITGFVLYLAAHGVQPVPDPAPPTAPRRAERDAYLRRYNARYVSVTRLVFRAAAAAAVIGLVMLAVGAILS